MIWRRLVYVCAVLAGLAFYIFHGGHFSWIIFLSILGFLPVELLLSLPVWLSTKIELESSMLQLETSKPFLVFVRARSKWPLAAVYGKLHRRNLFTGHHEAVRLRLWPDDEQSFVLPCQEEACGAVRFELARIRLLDMAGLIALPLKAPLPVLVLVRPAFPEYPPMLPPAALDQSALSQLAPGHPAPGSMREFFEIREYRSGDSVRDIHWKLSAKLDKPMVRESTLFAGASPHLCFDFFGSAAQLSKALGRVEALSRLLWEMERLHEIHWYGADKVLHTHQVQSQADYDDFLWKILALDLPETGEPMQDRLPLVRGPVLLVGAELLCLYEDAMLREVHT